MRFRVLRARGMKKMGWNTFQELTDPRYLVLKAAELADELKKPISDKQAVGLSDLFTYFRELYSPSSEQPPTLIFEQRVFYAELEKNLEKAYNQWMQAVQLYSEDSHRDHPTRQKFGNLLWRVLWPSRTPDTYQQQVWNISIPVYLWSTEDKDIFTTENKVSQCLDGTIRHLAEGGIAGLELALKLADLGPRYSRAEGIKEGYSLAEITQAFDIERELQPEISYVPSRDFVQWAKDHKDELLSNVSKIIRFGVAKFSIEDLKKLIEATQDIPGSGYRYALDIYVRLPEGFSIDSAATLIKEAGDLFRRPYLDGMSCTIHSPMLGYGKIADLAKYLSEHSQASLDDMAALMKGVKESTGYYNGSCFDVRENLFNILKSVNPAHIQEFSQMLDFNREFITRMGQVINYIQYEADYRALDMSRYKVSPVAITLRAYGLLQDSNLTFDQVRPALDENADGFEQQWSGFWKNLRKKILKIPEKEFDLMWERAAASIQTE